MHLTPWQRLLSRSWSLALGLFGLLLLVPLFLPVGGYAFIVAPIGAALIFLSALRLLLGTPDERIQALITEDTTYPSWEARPWAVLREQPPPYAVCTQCRTETDSHVYCPRCETGAWCMEVRDSADIPLAHAAMPGEDDAVEPTPEAAPARRRQRTPERS